jgi:hypothetical protein
MCDSDDRQFDGTPAMADLLIPAFLATGLLFGLATYRHRHLFGEGPPDPAHADLADGLKGRTFWVVLCTFLWPLQLVGGLHGLWRVRAARRH